MSSLQLTVRADFNVLMKHIDEIATTIESWIDKHEGYEYGFNVQGNVSFRETFAMYRFDSIDQLKDAIIAEGSSNVYIWRISIDVVELQKEKYSRNKLIDVDLSSNSRFNDAIDIDISKIPLIASRKRIDELAVILDNAEYIKATEVSDEDRELEELEHEHDEAVNGIVSILESFPDLQARITRSFQNEKEVQDFLFPILKSHYSELQEEDYLSKVAGTASKPDFGIESLGIAIEIKFTHPRKSFKQLKSEINDDSRQYFGRTSPFTSLIVFIYNGSSEATPVNYVADLEHIDVISKVIISPFMTPRPK